MRSAILRTLAYADIFNYPLTSAEINRWLISHRPLRFHLRPAPYYFLPSRQPLIKLRQTRHAASLKKLALARRVGEYLKFFPTILLVAVTGALAMRNSDHNDDIDLFIVTAPHTLWLTRLLVVPLISLFFKRRQPSKISDLRSKIYRDAICMNLWLDTTALTVPQPQRSLYTAHEVAQILPIVNKNRTYQHFLSANSWINQYLPNFKIHKSLIINHKSSLLYFILNTLYLILNFLAFKLQYWYMRRHMTREKVSLHYAFFHPRHTAKIVLSAYYQRLRRLGLRP